MMMILKSLRIFYTLKSPMSWPVAFLLTSVVLTLNIVQELYETNGSIKTLFLPKKNLFFSFMLFILPQLILGGAILMVFRILGRAMILFVTGHALTSPNDLSRGILGFILLFILSVSLNSFVNWVRTKLGFKQVYKSENKRIIGRYVLYFIIFALIAAVIIFGWIRFSTPYVQTQEQAVNLLQAKARKLQLKNYWAKTSCLSFQSSEKDRLYYSVRVYEKHGGNCPGNPGTAPLIAYFEISKKNGEILWFDTNKSSLIPFADYAKRFSSK